MTIPALGDHDRALTYCTYCPKMCRFACPVSNVEGREAVIPQAKMATLDELRRGARPWDAGFSEVLYACTGCLRCQTHCAHGNDVASALFLGRAAAHARGVGHASLKGFSARWRANDARERAALRERHVARVSTSAEIALLPGCDASDLAGVLFKVFDRAGLRVALADLPYASAGHPLAAAGDIDAFRQVARETAAALARYGTIVTSCPGCAHALARRYGAEGFAPRARPLHVTQLLAAALGSLPDGPRAGRALYHDPCFLGRHLGVYDQPRALAARYVAELVELRHARNDAICSGAGGLVPLTAPETARRIAGDLLSQARARGVDRVLTACPTTRRALRAAGGDVTVLDVCELVPV